MSSQEESSARIARRLAERELTKIQEARAHIVLQEAEFAKWMVASLLALNGGAILTTWAAEAVARPWNVVGSILFALGVLAAISTSYFIYNANRGILKCMDDWERYWIDVAELGANDDAAKQALDANFVKAFSKSRSMPKAGLASAALFLAGCFASAAGVL